MSLLVVIVLFTVGIIGIILLLSWYTRFIVGRMVGNKHAVMEYIAHTGNVPEAWLNKKDYVKKLDDLIRYLNTTTLVEDETNRGELLLRLTEVRNLWLEGKIGDEL